MGKSTKKSAKTPKTTKATETPSEPAAESHAGKPIEATEKGKDDDTLNDDINAAKRTHDAVTFSPHGARIAATNPHGAKIARALQESPCKRKSSLRHGNIYPNSEDSFGEDDEENDDSPIPFNLSTIAAAGNQAGLDDAAPTAPSATPAANEPEIKEITTTAGPSVAAETDTSIEHATTAEPTQTVETLASDGEQEGVSSDEDIIRDPHLSTDIAMAVGESLDAQEALLASEALAGNLTYEDILVLEQEEERVGAREQEALMAFETSQAAFSPPSPVGSTLSYVTDPMEEIEAQPAVQGGKETQPTGEVDAAMQEATTAPRPTTAATHTNEGTTDIAAATQAAYPTPNEAYGTGRDPQGTPRPPFLSTPRASQRPRNQTPASRRAAQAAAERRSAAVTITASGTTFGGTAPTIRNATPTFTLGGVTFNPVSTATNNCPQIAGAPQPTQRADIHAGTAHNTTQENNNQHQANTREVGTDEREPERVGGDENRREVIDVDQEEVDMDGDVTMVEADDETTAAPTPLPKWKDEDTPVPPPRTDTTDIPTGNKRPTIDRPEYLVKSTIPEDTRKRLDREIASGREVALAYGRYVQTKDEPLVYAGIRKDLTVHKGMINAEIIPIPTNTRYAQVDTAGYVGGTPPRLYAILLGSRAQLDRLLAFPVYDTEDSDVFYLNYKFKRASVLVILHSPILTVTDGEQRLVNRITEDVRSAIRASPKMLECARAYNDLVGLPNKTDLDGICILEKIIDSVHIKVTAGGENDDNYEWALHWKPATNNPDGERLYMSAARQLIINSAHAGGRVNENGGRIAWCQICRGINHTSKFCPFPKIQGWKGPVYADKKTTKNSTQGGRGRGSTRARGGRGNGGRGRGRGH